MPGCEMFGRVLPLATDDFLAHGIAGMMLNLFTFGFVLFFVIDLAPDASYSDCGAIKVYLIIQMVITVIGFLVDVGVSWASLQGTISNPKPRERITYFLYSGQLIILIQIANQLFGLHQYAIKDSQSCFQKPWAPMLSLGVIYIILILNLVLAFLILLAFSSSRPIASNEDYFHQSIAPIFLGTTYLHRSHPDSPKALLKEIAQLLGDLFGSEYLCLSDILVGLILVRKRQAGAARGPSSDSFDLNHSGDTKVVTDQNSKYDSFGDHSSTGNDTPVFLKLENFSYYSKYAEAVYGMPLKIYSNAFKGLTYMFFPRRPISSAITAVERTMDDGFQTIFCCFPGSWHVDKHSHPDLIYKSIRGSLFKSPFAVSVDHIRKAVIISTRGTLSTTDLLVDLYIKEQDIEWTIDGVTYSAKSHFGIHKITTTIMNELKEKNIFNKITELYSDYTLLCVGHSLGAGISSLLAFQIRNDPELANFKQNTFAICYSPPGFTISAEAVEYFKTFCSSVVVGDDFICRSNPRTIHKLKLAILNELSVCQQRKFDLFASVFGKTENDFTSVSENEPLAANPNIPKMYMPGNILYMKREVANPSSSNEQTFSPIWINSGVLEEEIVVSSTMLTDHFPNKVGDRLRKFFSTEIP